MKKTVIIIFLCLFMGMLFSNRMSFKDSQEKAFATKGFITQPEQLEISDSEGEII